MELFDGFTVAVSRLLLLLQQQMHHDLVLEALYEGAPLPHPPTPRMALDPARHAPLTLPSLHESTLGF